MCKLSPWYEVYLLLLYNFALFNDRYVTTNQFGQNRIRAQFEQEKLRIKDLIQTNGLEEAMQVTSGDASETPVVSGNQLEVSCVLVNFDRDNKNTFPMQKDVSLLEEPVQEEDGLFRPNVSRGILAEGETVSDLTHRSLKRVNLILEAVRTHVVIEEYGILLRVFLRSLYHFFFKTVFLKKKKTSSNP